MGCVQSKPEKRTRRKRGRRGKAKTSKSGPVEQQDISIQYPDGETNPEYKMQDVSAQYPDVDTNLEYKEHDFVDEQQVVVNKEETMREHPPLRNTSQFQSNGEVLAPVETQEGPRAEQTIAYPQQMVPGGPPDPPAHMTEIPVHSEDYVAAHNVGQNIQAAGHSYANSDHQVPPHLPANITNDRSSGAIANKPTLVYEGVSPERQETGISMSYGDLGNAVGREGTGVSAATGDRDNAMRSGDIGRRSQYVPVHLRGENAPRREQDQQPQRNDTYAPIKTSEVYAQRPLETAESKPSRDEDIGSICIDASTGEYRYYQNGVHIGNVDKESAESLSQNWPVCPGIATSSANQERLPKSLPLNQRNGANKETYVSPARPYISPNQQVVYEGQPIIYQPMGSYQGEDIPYAQEGYKGEIPAQPSPGYRGYYM